MKPLIEISGAKVFLGNNLDVLPTLPDNSVDSIVTDPPYELGFMGKKWDSTGIAYSVELWRECLRVLKPGGHILAFGGSRTWHRLAVAIEDAGFELRDSIAWLYGSGFPKSHNISKAIDKAAGAEREVIGKSNRHGGGKMEGHSFQVSPVIPDITAPATDDAKKWDGWGTALKPAFEPVVVGRKPLVGTVAQNVLLWGVGGLNIDVARIASSDPKQTRPAPTKADGWGMGGEGKVGWESSAQGRWPANIVLDEFTAGLLDEQQDASRFFYVAKASKKDRNEGLDELETRHNGKMMRPGNNTQERASEGFERFNTQPSQNFHPTVKPTDLMRYLIKLVTPAGGVVLDPFTGSGSTGKAALLDGYQFVGIEMTEEYLPIIEGRLRHVVSSQVDKTTLF